MSQKFTDFYAKVSPVVLFGFVFFPSQYRNIAEDILANLRICLEEESKGTTNPRLFDLSQTNDFFPRPKPVIPFTPRILWEPKKVRGGGFPPTPPSPRNGGGVPPPLLQKFGVQDWGAFCCFHGTPRLSIA